jgi:hypothetical protein
VSAARQERRAARQFRTWTAVPTVSADGVCSRRGRGLCHPPFRNRPSVPGEDEVQWPTITNVGSRTAAVVEDGGVGAANVFEGVGEDG